MKRLILTILLLSGSILMLLAIAQPVPATPLDAPPTPGIPEIKDQIEGAIRKATSAQAEKNLAYLVYDVQIDHLQVSADSTWATALLNPVDPETKQVVPAEPGLAVVRWDGQEWHAILPSDPAWPQAVQAAPTSLLTDSAKEYWLDAEATSQAQAESIGPFGGYLLPWAAGLPMYLTQSLQHDKYTPSGSSHYAFDFAMPGYPSNMFELYAAKGGTVKWFVDDWPDGYYNPKNPNEANFIVLEDKTTNPVSYQLYLHLAQNSIPPDLKVQGAKVVQGQFIGVADDTGMSTGNHLHFQVHTNPDSYWGTSVDITFNDVDINGGRPRIAEDLPYCRNDATYHDVCNDTQEIYISSNIVRGDVTPPRGDILKPASNGTSILSSSLHLEGWAADDDSGLYSAQFIANYNGAWHLIGAQFTSSPFSLDWDLCANQVPDGPVSLALRLRDQAGNQTTDLIGLRHVIKNYACPLQPPACIPAANQAALFAGSDYHGSCVLLGLGDYPAASSLGNLGADNAESILTGANVQATLYSEGNLRGRGETFEANDSNLSDNLIGANTVSSVKIQARSDLPAIPAPTWPAVTTTYTTGTSLSLVWDNRGASTRFQARLAGPTQTLTSSWQSTPFWHLGSLNAGSYSWQVRAGNSEGKSGWSTAQPLTIQSQALSSPITPFYTAPYTDDMDSSASDWISADLWALTGSENHTQGGTSSWRYGTGSAQGYDTGEPNSGDLTSPPIHIPTSGYYLRFWYRYETEGPGVYWDQRWVQISDSGPFTNVLQLSDDAPNTWLQSPAIDLSKYANHTIQVRFHFETLDKAFNTFKGWYIDDFKITHVAPPLCADTDNTPDEATWIKYGNTINAQICPGGDVDYYKFSGKAGDQVGVATTAQTAGSNLDTYLFLLDSDGSSILAQNDDQVFQVRTDSFVSYRLPRDGTYYVKVRAWDHPTTGSPTATYALKLTSEASLPKISITSPPGGTFLPKTPFSITAAVTDTVSGASHVDFLWHSGDWQTSDWVLLGSDWDSTDGWGVTFDPGGIPDQKDIAFFARAYDWAGNATGTGIWRMAIDRTPPVTQIKPLPGTQKSTAVLVEWEASDNLSGISHFDIQRQQGTNQWKDWYSGLDGSLRKVWFVVEKGATYGFRMRGTDRLGNAETYPPGAEATTNIPDDICTAPGDSWEPDNDPGTAHAITQTFQTQVHNYCNSSNPLTWQNDEDWLKISLRAGKLLSVVSTPQTNSAATVLELYDSGEITGTLLAKSSPAGFGEITHLLWQTEQDTLVYLRMRHKDGRVTGDDVIYAVSVAKGYPVFLPLLGKGQ